MIATSKRIAVAAGCVAGALHVGGVTWVELQPPARIAGGQVGASEASLGDGFEDMATGTLTGQGATQITDQVPVEDVADAVTAEEAADRPAPDATPPVQEDRDITAQTDPQDSLSPVAPLEEAAQPSPMRAATASPSATVAAAPAVAPVLEAVPVTAERAVPEAPGMPAPTPESVAQPTVPAAPVSPAPIITATPTLDTLTPLTPVAPQTPTPATAPEALKAEDPARTQVTQSLRPNARSRAFEERHKPLETTPAPRSTARQAATPTRTPTQQGNKAQDNRQVGQQDGSATAAPARRATNGTNAAQTGNAAVSNYPGKVMRKIQRVRRPNAGTRGTATIAFRIAGGGALAALSIARSSGNATLDQAAMRVIQRAAPFPAPPPGARRSFSIQIKGR
ncbi:MAG: TonB family protein [Pseudomonadota bacterium]